MRPAPCLLVLSAALSALPACLEVEEEIEVRPDGSLAVTMRAEGDLWDLAAGHPLALGGPWEPLDAATRAWVEEVGETTGGDARRRLEQGAFAAHVLENDRAALAARAVFARAEDLPRHLAPADAPYRTALLERDTRLWVERRGGRTVYTFERTFGARPFFPALDGDEWLPEDVREALDAKERLTREQVARVHRLLLEHLARPAAARPFTAALAALYTEGDASLPTAAHARTLARLEQALREVVSLERVQGLFDAAHAVAHGELEAMPDELDLEELVRGAARATLEASLAEEGVAPEVRNAVRERLEWNLTSYDCANDLRDEKLRVRVTMPGAVVGGNFDALEGRTASFELDGETLYGAPRRLVVISVVD